MPIFPVDKPLGLTSHDVVAVARRRLGTRRVGHAGTLDPLATGVLVLLSGEATKLSSFLTADRKSYLAWVALGASTPTLDAEGPLTQTTPQGDLRALGADSVRAAAEAFLTLTQQRPPAFSAIKQQGQRSYAAARGGDLTEPPARPVAYHQVRLLGFAPNRDALPNRFAPSDDGWAPAAAGRSFQLPPTLAPLPTALFHLQVAAGTYVRSFARDLAAALGVSGHLAGLVRTSSGSVDLSACAPLEQLGTAPGLDPAAALSVPTLQLDDDTALAVRQGKRVALPLTELTLLLDAAGELVAMVKPRDDAPEGDLRPIKILRAWQS